MARLNIIISIISALAACAVGWNTNKQYLTRFGGVTWDDAQWAIVNTRHDYGHYQSRISLANGYFGINLASGGPFMDVDEPVNGDSINGWPLFDSRQTFATIAGFFDSQPHTNGFVNGTNFPWLYQYGGESVISGIPHFGGLLLDVNGNLLNSTVDPSQITGFKSTLNIGDATMTWAYDWTPPFGAGVTLYLEYQMFLHKLHVNQAAVKLTVRTTKDVNVTVIDVLDGDCALRTDFVDKAFDAGTASIYSAVSPNGLPLVKAYVYSVLSSSTPDWLKSVTQNTDGPFLGSNESSIAQQFTALLTARTNYTFTKFIGVASTDAFPDAQNTAKNAAFSGAQTGWSNLLATHSQEWRTILPKDSVDSFTDPSTGTLPNDTNILDLQITAVTNPFYLIQNTIGANALAALGNNTDLIGGHSLSVCGLGSDCYGGLVFWDADVWMAPGLAMSHPDAARQIVSYRARMLPQAMDNIGEAYTSSQNQTGKFSKGGAVYPWTSSRFGNCTGSGPCWDYEYHLNGDIGLSFLNYDIATGNEDYFNNTLFPAYDAIAWFYGELLTLNTTSNKYELYNATDPDEYANNVNNPGFTMYLIKYHLEMANILRGRMGMEINQTWADKVANINIPVDTDANIILEYSAMNGSIEVKQADIVLIDDFLDVNNVYGLSDLDYYAGKQSPNGPGMTYGVFSIVANTISPSGCASYTYDLYGSEPYIREPWYQYSEQLLDNFQANGGTHPAFPFLTGMGGSNRVVPFGYLGMRPLIDSFNINPSLPPQIPYLRYRTLYWQGHPISAWSNATHTTLTRTSGTLPNANNTYNSQPIPVSIASNHTATMPLPVGGTLVVSNRLIGYNATFDGDIAQCKPVQSNTTWLPGQFPLAAIDGAVSTKWQPTYSNETSSITVDLGDSVSGMEIASFHFDWAQNPPVGYQIDLSDTLQFTNFSTVESAGSVNVSSPYIAAQASVITAYAGNTTDVTLDNAVTARQFVRLSIWGNQGSGPDEGATVAEFSVQRAGGGKLVPNSKGITSLGGL